MDFNVIYFDEKGHKEFKEIQQKGCIMQSFKKLNEMQAEAVRASS